MVWHTQGIRNDKTSLRVVTADSEVHVWGFCGQLHTHVAALSPIALRSSSTDTQQRVIRVDAGGYGFCAALTSTCFLFVVVID